MERLRKKDAEAGVTERPVTDAQRAEMAEVRKTYGARLAQEEIMYKARLVASFDPDERQKVEEHYRRDVERLTNERDRKIEKIRGES